MQFKLFYHSLVSDWNHGNAHFLRGIVRELLDQGHQVDVYEPRQNWSLTHLLEQEGQDVLVDFFAQYPELEPVFYDPETLDLDASLDGADVVLVHEWNDPGLVHDIGLHRKRGNHYALLFHDTHHRSVSAPSEMEAYDLEHYDGVLAFGGRIRQEYLDRGWAENVWTWHEAADTRHFRPVDAEAQSGDMDGDLVWIGNWGDDERTDQLHDYLIEPVSALNLSATMHGVRYPESARAVLTEHGINYAGWLPNWAVPKTFAQYRLTLHIPRQFYVTHLPGIPTIRVFEALACGIPLICSPWNDAEGLFRPGEDYLVAQNPEQMKRYISELLHDADRAESLTRSGLETIRSRHSCRHRVDELLNVVKQLGRGDAPQDCGRVGMDAGRGESSPKRRAKR